MGPRSPSNGEETAMTDVLPARRSRRVPWLLALAAAALLGAGAAVYVLRGASLTAPPPPPPSPAPLVVQAAPADVTAQAHQFCGACHAYPPPDSFPRAAWKGEVERGFRFAAQSDVRLKVPPFGQILHHFEERAPEELPPAIF